MGKILQIDIGKIESQIDTIIRNAAMDAGYKEQDMFVTAIADFYSSFHPKKYERTFSSYLGSSASLEAPFKRLGKMSYEGGIKVGAEYIPGNPYSSPKGYVFGQTLEGIHGIAQPEYITDAPSEYMNQHYQQIIEGAVSQMDAAFRNISII